ncbi:MAG: complex I NDUFA9 subunit family protein, partial [Gammaproteobacteria bacterium]|nr:complex I NDUFA9 subunit family protein [Gammaproteobacteria bacterium]
MDNQNICVLGGSGFIGTHLISKLSRQNKSIRVLTRRKSYCNHLLVLDNVEVVETDIHQQAELERHFAGMDTVINLVGILNEHGHKGDGFRQAHVELPRKILTASHGNKIQRILHISALNADANSGSSHYLRTKGEGENHFHAFAGTIQVTSFRPSIIFGHDDSFFNRFAKLLKLSPIFFPLACPNARFAPLYVEDLVQFMINSLNNKETFGRRYDLCGPKEYTLEELVTYTAETAGLKRVIIRLPDFISR